MAWAVTAIAVMSASSIYQGEQQKKAGKKSLAAQERAQQQTFLSSLNDEKQAQQANRKANKRPPDITSILFQERAGAENGMGSTILSGGEGVGLLGSKPKLMG